MMPKFSTVDFEEVDMCSENELKVEDEMNLDV